MPKDQAVVFSDIHIGDNTNTCWYQRSVHEPYLRTALDWVIQRADQLQEVILLGDLVDLWTYPPSVKPPSMEAIIAANPDILGQGGALSKVVKALQDSGGKVTYMLGNHDGTLTVADIDALRAAVGPLNVISPKDYVYVLTGRDGARTAFSHGHYWTMFNAPDDRLIEWNTLPIGHFVTRAFSYKLQQTLPPGKTVADLPNMGYPDGFDIWPFVKSLPAAQEVDIADLLLNYVAKAADMPWQLPIVLPNGDHATMDQARRVYRNLFMHWRQKEEGSLLNAARAARADADGNYLAWFAQRLAMEASADQVVFGHTHTPIGGLGVSPINYYNSGFECASVPDSPPKRFTFTVVDLAKPTAQIKMVYKVADGNYAIADAPVEPLPSVILPPAMDFSCYIRILNLSPYPMLRNTPTHVGRGYSVVPVPEDIKAGGRADVWIQDNPGISGSEIEFKFLLQAPHPYELTFTVSCPTGLFPNTITVTTDPGPSIATFAARSGTAHEWGPTGYVPRTGHPLQVVFEVGEDVGEA